MTAPLTLIDHPSRDDLRVFLERLQRAGEPEVRLVVRDGVLAVFGCTQTPLTLTDPAPVVLVMRAFELSDESESLDASEPLDVVVQGRALLDRLARRGGVSRKLQVPEVQLSAAWAGVLPPRSGWEQVGVLDAKSLVDVAQQGMKRVAAMLPTDPGEAVVRTVRSKVWGVSVAPGVPAAAAFAAETMGFLHEETRVLLAHSATWVRLRADRGQVFVRARLGQLG